MIIDDVWFIMMLIYLIPFAGLGVWKFIEWIMPKFRTRYGYVKITRVIGSGHLKDQWVKPFTQSFTEEVNVEDPDKAGGLNKVRQSLTGHFIKIDSNKTAVFHNNPSYVYFEGGVKRAFFDEECNQLSINDAKKVTFNVGPEMIDTFGKRMWNAGRLELFSMRRKQDIFIIVAAGAAAFACMLSFYALQNTQLILEALPEISGVCQTAASRMVPV